MDSQKKDAPKFEDASEDVIEGFNLILQKLDLPFTFKACYLSSTKQKKMVTMKRLPAEYSKLLDKDVLIVFNESMYQPLDDLSKEILFEQEIAKISLDMENGNIKTVKPDLNTFSGLIKKWGIDAVAKANQVESLLSQQIDDAKKTK